MAFRSSNDAVAMLASSWAEARSAQRRPTSNPCSRSWSKAHSDPGKGDPGVLGGHAGVTRRSADGRTGGSENLWRTTPAKHNPSGLIIVPWVNQPHLSARAARRPCLIQIKGCPRSWPVILVQAPNETGRLQGDPSHREHSKDRNYDRQRHEDDCARYKEPVTLRHGRTSCSLVNSVAEIGPSLRFRIFRQNKKVAIAENGAGPLPAPGAFPRLFAFLLGSEFPTASIS